MVDHEDEIDTMSSLTGHQVSPSRPSAQGRLKIPSKDPESSSNRSPRASSYPKNLGVQEGFQDNPHDIPSPPNDQDGISTDGSNYDDEEEEDGVNETSLSLVELLYSASSYHAIARPVSITMILAALAAVYINTEETIEQGAKQFASVYTVWKIDDGDGGSGNTGKNLALSIGNTLVMVSVIAAMTFGIVLLYKFRCMKCLIGYMIFSSASLLGFLGDYMSSLAIEIYRIPIDVITYYLFMYNFAIVGVISIFYQHGIPSVFTQIYLVATSVILAWNLSHFDDWTAWTLLIMLALYDLCAVLTPCGPLKALVNLMQEDNSPEMPGLLYEAQLPAGSQRPGDSTRNTNNSNRMSSVQSSTSTRDYRNQFSSANVSNNEEASQGKDVAIQRSEITTSGVTVELSKTSNSHSTNTEPIATGETLDTPSSASPLTKGPTMMLPLAIARLYRLPLVSTYGASASSQQKNRKSNLLEDDSSSVNDAPLLEASEQLSSASIYSRNLSVEELLTEVEVELPRNGGRIIKRLNRNRDFRYEVLNRNGDLKRVLVVDSRGKVFEVLEEEDDTSVDEKGSNSIRLGLGDFIFYSVLVAKAALYSFTTFATCMLVILAGLGGTLVLLSVYHSALPALPISIFLGVFFYLLTRILIEPWVETVMKAPFYV